MHSPRELDRFLKTAVRACREAGRHQVRFFGKIDREEHKGEIDLVTSVDRECEQIVIDILAAAFPGHGCLAEERPPSGTGRDYLWLVDPLDGTTNYARGFPFFCVSVALAFRGKVLAGAVFNPLLKELFTARRGGGASLNGKGIAVTRRQRLGECFLATGFPYDIRRSRRNNLDHFSRFATRALAIRRAGSAALDLAYVAAGRFDGFWELKLKPWDMAAGSLLVEEAGGVVTGRGKRPWSLGDRDIVASNGLIHGQLLALLEGSPPSLPKGSGRRK